MNYSDMSAAVDKILLQSDEIGKELEVKFDALQIEYEKDIKNMEMTQEEMNRPFTW